MISAPKKIFIVDDHRLVVDGFKALLQDQPDFEIAGICYDATQALKELENLPIDILLTDVNMPGLSGVELATQVLKKFPQVKVLALSMFCEGGTVSQMVNAGVSGYVLKNISKAEFLEALTKIAAGQTYFSSEVTLALTQALKNHQQTGTGHLTNREIEIVKLINQEFSSKQIADTLFISERTVETHRKNIHRKTGTQNVVGLLRYARENFLL